jgi:hypothetical protein
MTTKSSNSLKELKGLREAVLAEEKAKTQARLQSLPPGPAALAALAREEAEIANQPVLEHQNDVAIDEVSPTPSPRPPVANANAVRPSVPGPSAAATARSKEPALIIPLTPKIQERLQKHVENTRWSPADLVIELIRAFLHRGYPEIRFGDQLIAKGGSYRTFERNPMESVLKIISGQGVFDVTVKLENAEYQNWLSYFSGQKAGNPEKSARQVCLFALQTHLEGVEDFKAQAWVKNIPTEAYLVASAV